MKKRFEVSKQEIAFCGKIGKFDWLVRIGSIWRPTRLALFLVTTREFLEYNVPRYQV